MPAIILSLLLLLPYGDVSARHVSVHRAAAQCKIKRVFTVNGPTCWGGYDYDECTGEIVNHFAYCE